MEPSNKPSMKSDGKYQRYRAPRHKQSMKTSVICKLRNREIFALGCSSRKSNYVFGGKRMLTTMPSRFAFPLKSIVNDHTLYEEGHVFLGFSSNDQFLMSYTEKIEEASHTGFLSHVYTLHWWLFQVGVSAQKIGSVRLFGNEEIECSLCLCYAEWPNLKSQIIVYGWRKFSESCYITIAAVPSISPCKQCIFLEEDSIVEDERVVGHRRCLHHGFAIHFKQASGASKCGVLSACGLNIDGMVVLNIGHSIAVISTGVLDEYGDTEQLPLSSIKRADCEESVVDSELASVLRRDDQQEEMRREKAARVLQWETGACFQEMSWDIHLQEDAEEKLPHPLMGDATAMSGLNELKETRTSSVYDIQDCDDIKCISLAKRSISCDDKENLFESLSTALFTKSREKEGQSKTSTDPYFDPDPINIVLRDKLHTEGASKFDEYDFDNYKDEKYNQVGNHKFLNKTLPCNPNKHPQTWQRTIHVGAPVINNVAVGQNPINCSDSTQVHSKWCGCAKQSRLTLPPNTMQSIGDDNELTGSGITVTDCPGTRRRRVPAALQSFLPSSSKSSSPLMVISVINNKLHSFQEPPRSDLTSPSPPASGSSGSMYCSAESYFSQGVGKIVNESRNSDGLVSFSENFYGPIPRENITMDDPLPAGESGLFYCSVLCQGAAEEMLHPKKIGQPLVQAFSQHLVLDLEHVIFDILRTRCYNAYKYGYLVDYEANVIDVCSDTKSVVLHIVALLNIAPHRSKPLSELSCSKKNGSNNQQAEFILCWRLHTGRYEVVVARPLKHYHEKKSGDWNGEWIVKMDCDIRHQCSVRANVYRSVYLLDNASVFRRRSLNVVWNCDKTIAIKK